MADKAAAQAAKDAGNKEFKAGNYDAALACYDRAIALDPADPLFPANRAMVSLKLEQWDQAERDCTAALQINDKHAKALDRRGQARLALNKFSQALVDFESAKHIDPKTKNVDKNIEVAKSKMSEENNNTKEEEKSENKVDLNKEQAEQDEEDNNKIEEAKNVEDEVSNENQNEENKILAEDETSRESESQNGGQTNSKTDEELLMEIQNIQKQLEERIEKKIQTKMSETIEKEKEELEEERKRLIEERINYDKLKAEFLEEEQKRAEVEQTRNSGDNRILERSEQEEIAEEEVVPVRNSRWYPDVGEAPPPNLHKVKGTIDNRNRNYNPKSARKIEIFHDAQFLKNKKVRFLVFAMSVCLFEIKIQLFHCRKPEKRGRGAAEAGASLYLGSDLEVC